MYMVSVFRCTDDGFEENFVGWFSKKRKALHHVINNKKDINEFTYDHALIQYVPEGFYQISPYRIWLRFNYNTKKYEIICERRNPDFTENKEE